MKLPVFEEVKTSDFSLSILMKHLHRAGAGKSPIYIHLEPTDPVLARDQADSVYEALVGLDVHPQLPFPCYIITPALRGHDYLPHAKAEQDLPSHFRKKSKRLKNKEQSLLNRVRLVADKLTNQDLPQLDAIVNEEMSEHKKLYKVTRESHFYELLLKALK
tara:strand:- start:3717 stop:4199 length:483 start_codon:yes stop_codon:yes gene_type:complete